MTASWTRHPVIAGITGVLAGALVILLIEWLAQQGLGRADLAGPTPISDAKLAAVLLAWVLGAGTAALVATGWQGGRTRVPGIVAAGVLMVGSVATLFALPHPAWMWAGALLLMPAAAWLGTGRGMARGH